ncbi:MAG: methyltransferase domain-containing protein [Hyphomonadaceae bacterium]|nr:methyltransferase domain-containing protein [Hyphomonadaceae bacterium]
MTMGFIEKLRLKRDRERGFVLHKFTRSDGSFDYERYKAIQTDGNHRKLDRVFVSEDNIRFLSEVISTRMPEAHFGLCHGTRRGLEQNWFAKYLECEVIGTEISDTASQFPNTIQWDFHDVKPEWVGAVDFIYSNSFDHSYDPEACLTAWMSCLRPGGLCFLEHTTEHGPANTSELDPFGAEITLLPYLILKWGKGRFSVVDLLAGPALSQERPVHYLVVRNT